MNDFLRGAVAMAGFAIGLFFLRYWRATADRLFLLFCGAFWLLALSWALVSLGGSLAPYAHVPRFSAFLVIALAVLDKNRRRKGS